jgi:transcription initiation factor TFIIIB Brf1 subunit/transcription initiation factor TFIIB
MGNIVKLKGCKRCGGDLFLERDTEEIRIVCLQCSAVYAQRLVALVKKPVTKSYYAR